MKHIFYLILFFVSSSYAADSLQYADRYYISSTLNELFGPAANRTVTENILKNGNVFGGACDVYEQVRIGENKFANPEFSRCFNGKHEFDYAIRGKAGLLRESWMLRACTDLTTSSATFNYFKNNNLKNFTMTAQGIYKIQQLFDPNAKLNEKLNEYYVKKMSQVKSNEKKLQFLILELCTYPTWQLI